MDLAPLPIAHAFLALIGGLAAYFDLRYRLLPDWLTIGGMVVGLAIVGITGGWDALWPGVGGLVAGLGVFWLFWTFGMLGAGDVLFMGACGALLGWPLVLFGLLYATLAGALIGLAFSLRRGHLGRVLRNLVIVVTSLFRPGRRRVKLSELPTDELPYAVGIALGCGFAALSVYVPALRLI
jgi:prepilin peptidase CpaA